MLIDLHRSYLEALQLRDEAVYDYACSLIRLAAAIGIAPKSPVSLVHELPA